MSRFLNRPGLMAAGAALLGAALLGAAAFAQNAPATGQSGQPGDRFAARDTNRDGFIDKSEASQRMAAHFDTIDADHDGKISPDEIKSAWSGRMGHHRHHHFGPERMAHLDTDHDGKLSFNEMTAHAKSRFDRLDANHDGFIDSTEMPKPGEHKNWKAGDGSSDTGR